MSDGDTITVDDVDDGDVNDGPKATGGGITSWWKDKASFAFSIVMVLMIVVIIILLGVYVDTSVGKWLTVLLGIGALAMVLYRDVVYDKAAGIFGRIESAVSS